MNCRLLLLHPPATEPPTLRLLGARGKSLAPPPDGPLAWLCAAFGIARQTDWPIAPWALLGEGEIPGDGYWLRADPVSLRLLRNHLILFGGPSLAVEAAEARTWCDALNRHFGSDGLHFAAPHPQRWYLRLTEDAAPATHPLATVLGREIRPFLPREARWLKLLNEIQMLLHADPRNAAREEQGLAPLNSVWLWGGGKRQGTPQPPCAMLYGDEPLARGLALAAGIPAHPLPSGAAECLAGNSGDILAVLDTPAPEVLERDWLLPLKAALSTGQIDTLEVIVPDSRSILVSRRDLWKFWRRA